MWALAGKVSQHGPGRAPAGSPSACVARLAGAVPGPRGCDRNRVLSTKALGGIELRRKPASAGGLCGVEVVIGNDLVHRLSEIRDSSIGAVEGGRLDGREVWLHMKAGLSFCRSPRHLDKSWRIAARCDYDPWPARSLPSLQSLASQPGPPWVEHLRDVLLRLLALQLRALVLVIVFVRQREVTDQRWRYRPSVFEVWLGVEAEEARTPPRWRPPTRRVSARRRSFR